MEARFSIPYLLTILLFVCLVAPIVDGFALRLYSSFGRDLSGLRPRTFSSQELPSGGLHQEQSRWTQQQAGTANSLANTQAVDSRVREHPVAAVRPLNPWQKCGPYEECKRNLIKYLQRVLRAKRWLDTQSTLPTDLDGSSFLQLVDAELSPASAVTECP